MARHGETILLHSTVSRSAPDSDGLTDNHALARIMTSGGSRFSNSAKIRWAKALASASARRRSTRRRSCDAFRNQAAVFSMRTGSCAIEDYAFANHRGRERCFEVKLPPEVARSGHKNITSGAKVPDRAVPGPSAVPGLHRLVPQP